MGSVLKVNANNWEKEVLQSDILTVVDFWHTQCPWCLQLNSILEEVAEEYKDKIKFTKLNVLANPADGEIAIHHGVMGTPTLMFFCKGRAIGQTMGLLPKEHLKHLLDYMLETHKECLKQSTELSLK